jgi:hypothetical protein
MNSGKKVVKSLSKKEQLWLPATPEKASLQGSFYQPKYASHILH